MLKLFFKVNLVRGMRFLYINITILTHGFHNSCIEYRRRGQNNLYFYFLDFISHI